MQKEMMNNMENFMTPFVKTNKLVAEHVEKMVQLQMKSLQNYIEMVVNQMKAAAEVSSPNEAQEYMKHSMETFNSFRQKMMDDVKAAAELGSSIKDDYTKLAEENVNEFTKMSKTAAENAAAAAEKAVDDAKQTADKAKQAA